jgi:acylphosphatase
MDIEDEGTGRRQTVQAEGTKMTIARHLRICGQVQGVFYRGWAVETARSLELAGWVRNRRDGTVEALVQGDEGAVAQFIAHARTGPPAARVSDIDTRETDLDESLVGFRQGPTV